MSTSNNHNGAKKRIFSLLLAAITVGILAGAAALLERHFERRYAHLEEALKWAGKKGDYFQYDANVGWRGKPIRIRPTQQWRMDLAKRIRLSRYAWDIKTGKPHILLLGDSNAWDTESTMTNIPRPC
jgi:hypothetical protein